MTGWILAITQSILHVGGWLNLTLGNAAMWAMTLAIGVLFAFQNTITSDTSFWVAMGTVGTAFFTALTTIAGMIAKDREGQRSRELDDCKAEVAHLKSELKADSWRRGQPTISETDSSLPPDSPIKGNHSDGI